MFVNTADRNISSQIVLTGTYEETETSLLSDVTKAGMVVIDVGASAGYYTLMAAALVGNRGKVYAFEPEPGSYQLLLRNIDCNGYTNVVPICKAVSDRQATSRLFTDRFNLGGSSLSQSNVANLADTLTIETTTLDGYFREVVGKSQVDVLKIDAQGAEGQVIDGAVRTLERNNPKILMEFWPYGMRRLGSDPLLVLRTVARLGFVVSLIDEQRATTRPLDSLGQETICQRQDQPEYSVNLYMEKQTS